LHTGDQGARPPGSEPRPSNLDEPGLTPGAERLVTRDQVLASLGETGSGDSDPPFLDVDTGGLPPPRMVPGLFGTVRITRYAPERVEMSVEMPGTVPVFLTSTERSAVGWRVRVEGELRPVLKVNLFIKGTIVPPGQDAVTITVGTSEGAAPEPPRAVVHRPVAFT